MKSNDFVVIKENIVDAAHNMQKDHEVQMARGQLYAAADAAIEIHRLLKNVSEEQGLDGWVAAKITMAEDYLNTVRDHLKYEHSPDDMAPPSFDAKGAAQDLDNLLGEMSSSGASGAGGFGTSMAAPKMPNPFKRKKVKEATPAVPGQPAAPGAAPAAGQPPKPGAPAPAAGTPPAAGAAPAPAAPGTPAPVAGQPPKPGVPAAPGAAPAGTATPPNPAQVKKDTDALAGILGNPTSPLNAELQALIKKAASLPK